MNVRLLPALAAVLCAVTGGGQPVFSQPVDPFDDCRAAVAAAPDVYTSYRCFLTVGFREDAVAAADQILSRYERTTPIGWPSLVRGHFSFSNPPVALDFYSEALRRFEQSSHSDADLGQVLALTNRRTLLRAGGHFEQAAEEVRRATEIGRRTNHSEARLRASLLEARYLLDDRSQFATALRAFERAERAAFPDGPANLQREVLSLLSTAYFRLGRFDQARAIYQRWRDLAETEQQTADLDTIDFNLLNLRLTALEHLPDPRALEELEDDAEATLDRVVASGNDRIAVYLHRALAEMLQSHDRERSQRHLDQCDAAAQRVGSYEVQQCNWIRAQLQARTDPNGAIDLAKQSLAVASTAADPTFELWAARSLMHVAQDALPAEQAVQVMSAQLQRIDEMRGRQSGLARAEFQSVWMEEAQFLIARLIEMGDIEQAFELAERRRAQVLLSHLSSQDRVTAAGAEVAPELAAIRERITTTQRLLLDPELQGARRVALESELDELELAEADADERASALRDSVSGEPVASLNQIQDDLHPNEALLTFVLGLDRDLYGNPGGGAWAFYVTRSDFGVVPIADRRALQSRLEVYEGLFRTGSTWQPAAAEKLYELILEPATVRFGPEIDTLLVAPDGSLAKLPFASLAAFSAHGELRISVVASGSVLQRLRTERIPGTEAASPRPVAVLLGAPPGGTGITAPVRSSSVYESVATLPELPWAKRELSLVDRRLAEELSVHSLVADRASEQQLAALLIEPLSRQQNSSADPVRLFHIAAHAIVDAQAPSRSSIVLAPGTQDHDGLLQPREIERLPLSGAIAVLSACDTEAGKNLDTEGLLSLARSFFTAGASAVVATRWPIRDDHAYTFLKHLYAGPDDGQSETLAAAMHRARAQTRAAGLPAQAWAGFTLLGDPSVVLPIAPVEEVGSTTAIWWSAAALVTLGLLFAARRVWP